MVSDQKKKEKVSHLKSLLVTETIDSDHFKSIQNDDVCVQGNKIKQQNERNCEEKWCSMEQNPSYSLFHFYTHVKIKAEGYS